MANSGNQPKKANTFTQKNPLETLNELGSSVVKNTTQELKKMGSGMFDQLVGNYDSDTSASTEQFLPTKESKQSSVGQRKEFSLFNYGEYYEKEIVKRQIKELTEQIKKEIELIKKADTQLLNEVKDIEKIAMEELPDKPGIYHVRFLELVLNMLRTLRARVGESKTWMQAMISRRKKRGSLFAALTKKKGTQYSLSQELSSSRSVQ